MEGWLKGRAFHSWVDPKEFKSKEEWDWAEMNLYHSADVSRQILSDIESAIADAVNLRKKERGELDTNLFERLWKKNG